VNRRETAQLLTLCAAFDSRTIGESDVMAWADVLSWVPYVDAEAAVKDHYARQAQRVMPADVIAGVRRIRRDRVEGADASFTFDGDPDDVQAYRAALIAHRRQIGDGATPPARPELVVSVPPKAIANTFRSLPRQVKPGPVVIEAEPWSPPSEESKARARAALAQAAKDAGGAGGARGDGAA
jgi:hypothetical protein